MKFLKLLSLVLVFIGLVGCYESVGPRETGSFDRTLQVSGPVDLNVVSGAGNIKVHAGGDGRVHVYAVIHARGSWSGMSASEKIKKLQANPPVEQQGNTIHIGRIDDRDLQRNVSIDYDLTAPAQTKVSSQTGSGDQEINGVQLAVNAHTGSGNIMVENIGADVRARSGSGDLRIDGVKGALDAEAGSGNIRGHGIAGGVSANTGSGTIEIEQVAAGNVRAEAGSGNVRLHGVQGGLKAETGSGDITVDGNPTGDWRVGAGSGNIDLKIPSTASFNIDARTSSGSLKVNHQVTMQGSISRDHVQGKVGNGGALVDLHTGSGDIQVN
ncbi:MAG TPA: DUF4097 family beta strand repeat-containing protein [Candidatus Angelobacter sp.]|nr:DUF4097 family beta strand repeat-containing protein [Candidatus Angelobacter sp.]